MHIVLSFAPHYLQVALLESQVKELQDELNQALRDKARLAEELVKAHLSLDVVRKNNEHQACRVILIVAWCWSCRV